MKLLDIGEVADSFGVPASTLRYYDEIGLISSVARHGLRRQFPPEVRLQLQLIALGKAAGFSLDDISRMLGPNGQPDLPRDELHARADALEDQIQELTALRDTLRHVADCAAPSHMECPKFRKILELATRRKRTSTRTSRRKENIL